MKMLSDLRALMAAKNIAAYIIPNKDPHLSEYLPAPYQLMPILSGFTGSTGVMVVTQDFAGVWTDSRYFLQAEEELKDSAFDLVKLTIPHTPEHVNWVRDNVEAGGTIGIDAQLFSVSAYRHLKKILSAKNIEIVLEDLISPIWENRPDFSTNPVFVHDIQFTGLSRADKTENLRKEMKAKGCNYYLMTALDDIAWTFNLRCDDVPYNPVAVSYALIGLESATLFINLQKVSLELAEQFDDEKVALRSYHSVFDRLNDLVETDKVYLDLKQVNAHLYSLITAKAKISTGISLAYYAKALKNNTELANIRTVMVKDGVALVRFFKWLEENIGQQTITEVDVDTKLTAFRAAQEHYIGNSFSTIAGYNGNGAIVHYRAQEATCATLQPKGMLLLDSGGQYLDGTTDITRTITFGAASAEQVRNNTLVLKGHIAIALAQFPKGSTGGRIDALARTALWKYGLDYGHGTGHGVGFFMNVHEGPQSFGRSASAYPQGYLQPGMLITNEPGFYKTGEYGIRIENLLLVVESEYQNFYRFETLSWCPFDKNLIDKSLLSDDETKWINNYHQQVFNHLAPHLTAVEVDWLKEKTTEL